MFPGCSQAPVGYLSGSNSTRLLHHLPRAVRLSTRLAVSLLLLAADDYRLLKLAAVLASRRLIISRRGDRPVITIFRIAPRQGLSRCTGLQRVLSGPVQAISVGTIERGADLGRSNPARQD